MAQIKFTYSTETFYIKYSENSLPVYLGTYDMIKDKFSNRIIDEAMKNAGQWVDIDVKIFTADELREHWGNGKPIDYNGNLYRVGKMSYGDYFFEPFNPKYPLGKGEKEPFEKGVLWPEKLDQYHYIVDLSDIKKVGRHLGDSKNKGRHLGHLEDFKIEDKAKISEGSGLDSGKIATIVARSKIITDGRGIPKNVPGAYKPVDWKKEIAIQFEDGTYGTMFKNRLIKQPKPYKEHLS